MESCPWLVLRAARSEAWLREACSLMQQWDIFIYKWNRGQNVAYSQQGYFVEVQGKKYWIMTREWRWLAGGGGIQTGLWSLHEVLLEKQTEHAPSRRTKAKWCWKILSCSGSSVTGVQGLGFWKDHGNQWKFWCWDGRSRILYMLMLYLFTLNLIFPCSPSYSLSHPPLVLSSCFPNHKTQ